MSELEREPDEEEEGQAADRRPEFEDEPPDEDDAMAVAPRRLLAQLRRHG